MLINCNYKEVFNKYKIDHVITDPPYELNMSDLVSEFREHCLGTIIVFSYLGDVPRGADEYHVWKKPASTKNTTKKCANVIEAISIFHGQHPVFNSSNYHWSQAINCHEDRIVEKLIHPFQKPVTLLERLIRLYTCEGDIVFDPFCGSASTIKAANNCNRRAIGSEVDPRRYSDATARLGARL
jgi:DNA modification methylase